jgi:PAS domain-containing protein
LVILDPDLKPIEVNKAYANFLGINQKRYLAGFPKRIPAEERELLFSRLRDCIRDHKSTLTTNHVITKSGDYKLTRWLSQPIYDNEEVSENDSDGQELPKDHKDILLQ